MSRETSTVGGTENGASPLARKTLTQAGTGFGEQTKSHSRDQWIQRPAEYRLSVNPIALF